MQVAFASRLLPDGVAVGKRLHVHAHGLIPDALSSSTGAANEEK